MLLKEVGEQWDIYTTFQTRLSILFDYFYSNFISWRELPSLPETSHLILYKMIYKRNIKVEKELDTLYFEVYIIIIRKKIYYQ